jgi:hypothetical protein
MDEIKTHDSQGGSMTRSLVWHHIHIVQADWDIEEPGGATRRFFTIQARRVGDPGK